MKQFQNFGWLSADDVIRVLLSFALMAVIARHLGASDYGALSYLFGVVGLLAPLTSVGLDVIAVRQLVADPGSADLTLGTALAIRAFGALLAIAAATAFVAIFGGPDGVTLRLAAMAALVLPFQSTMAFDAYLKAREKMGWLAAPRTLVRIVMALVTVWLVAAGGRLPEFVVLRVLEAGLMAVSGITACVLATGKLRLRIDPARLRSMLREGMPLFLSSLAVMVYMRIDQIMLGQLATGEALGQYSVAVRISESVFFVPMALQAAFYPGLVRSWTDAPESWQDELQHYYDIAALAMLVLAIAVTAFATAGLTPLLGPGYGPAVPMIWILALSIPFVGLGVARSTYLTIRGWLWTAPLTTALGALLNVGLNFYLIPAWGGVGAAVATVVSYWLAAHGTCFMLPWLRPVGRELTRALDPVGAARRSRARWRVQRSAPE